MGLVGIFCKLDHKNDQSFSTAAVPTKWIFHQRVLIVFKLKWHEEREYCYSILRLLLFFF